MKPFHLLCFFVLILGMTACNQKPDAHKAETTTTDEQKPAPDPNSGDNQGHDYTFLTHQMLHYQASVISGKDPKEQPYAGQWIDLDPDGTFKAGKHSEQTHGGTWTYNHDSGILLLKPDNTNFKNSEWKVLFNDDMVVFIGTPTYGDNTIQIKLVRSDKFPE